MHSNDYQLQAARTLISKPDRELNNAELMMVWNALGLAGEAGEVVELVKKMMFDNHPFDGEQLKKELGDVLWYAAALCTGMGISLESVMLANVEKLKARYPQGWDPERSKKRGDGL